MKQNKTLDTGMNRYLPFIAFLLLTVFAVNPLAAQDQQQTENSLLPEIDPQDIEIRSEFKARFPGLRRQPILGFEPAPDIYQIDPNRMPFIETQEQVVANLPVSRLSRPEPPQYYSLYNPEKINLFSRIGFGSFGSPEAQIWGVKRLSDETYVGGDLDYFSSEGHLDNEQSAFRFFNVNGEFATKLGDKTRLDLTGGFENNFNQMFDLNPDFSSDGSRKDYNSFYFGTALHHFKNSITGWNAQADIRFFDVSLDAGSLSGTAEEMVYNASVAKKWVGSHVNETFTVHLGINGGSYDNSANSAQWMTVGGGVMYERLFNYSTKVTVDGSVYYGTDSFDSKIYLAPSVKVEHPLMDFVTLRVKAGAEPFFKTIEELHSTNRFLNVSSNLRHSYRFNGLAELELDYSKVGALTMGVQYQSINDYPIFIRNTGFTIGLNPPPVYYYETNYADVYKIRAYAGFSHEIIAHRFWLHGKVYVQKPQIKNNGQIPYEEEFGVQSGFSLRPIDKLTIEAWANYVGPRQAFNEELGGFLLLGGQLDVQITQHIGAYVKLKNILNQEYQVWQGFTERPFQVYGGITVKL
ncbi:MAG TPA: hypothetical protein VF181_09385 [Balneolaceae bacterium]